MVLQEPRGRDCAGEAVPRQPGGCHTGVQKPGSEGRAALQSPDTEPAAAHGDSEEGGRSRREPGLCTAWGAGTERSGEKLLKSEFNPHCPPAEPWPGSPPSWGVAQPPGKSEAAWQEGDAQHALAPGELCAGWGPSHHRASLTRRHSSGQ